MKFLFILAVKVSGGLIGKNYSRLINQCPCNCNPLLFPAGQLRALGYVGGDEPGALEDELETLALSGPDPNDRLEDHQLLLSAWRQISEQRYDSYRRILAGE